MSHKYDAEFRHIGAMWGVRDDRGPMGRCRSYAGGGSGVWAAGGALDEYMEKVVTDLIDRVSYLFAGISHAAQLCSIRASNVENQAPRFRVVKLSDALSLRDPPRGQRLRALHVLRVLWG